MNTKRFPFKENLIEPESEPANNSTTSHTQLFTVEEAFVRLGQSCQDGELLVLNKDESIHVFVENGYVVQAYGESEQGEAAIIHALNLESANFVWAAGAKPLAKDLKIDIRQYVLRQSLSRDLEIARSLTQKPETLALPKTKDGRSQPPEKNDSAGFYLITAVDPMGKVPLKNLITLVGRESYCDWIIDDARISRKHCVLQIASRGVLVRDLNATNGTFINDKLVTDGYMKPGDKLSLGSYAMTLRAENESSLAESPNLPVPNLSEALV